MFDRKYNDMSLVTKNVNKVFFKNRKQHLKRQTQLKLKL